MTKHPRKYKDTPNRLQCWNYSAQGKYYMTLCTYNRQPQLGRIENGIMILSEYGRIVESEILKIPDYHKRIILDEWIIMPDHVHLLIELGALGFDNGVSLVGETVNGETVVVGKIHEFSLQQRLCLSTEPTNDDLKQYRALRRRMIIPKILGKFQMLTSKQINILRNTPGQPNWQHDYYDHIIRNHASYLRIKQYIIDNVINLM